ncbi:hypothetical protein D3C75_1092860 [compost metagenome]
MHQSNLIQFGGLVLPRAHKVHNTWVPASAVVTKCTTRNTHTSIERTAPTVGPSSDWTSVNIAAVVSFLVASSTVPPSNFGCS